MKSPESILVLTDSAMKVTRALRRGMALAKASGAKLHLAMIVHDPQIDAAGMDLRIMRLAQRAYLQERREWLEERRVRASLAPGQVTTSAVWSPGVVNAFLEMVHDSKADLVIKDTSCGEAFLPGLLTPMDWKLLRLCPVPLMLMVRNGPVLPRRIVAAVDTASDPDGLNQDIIGTARDVVDLTGANLHLVSAFPKLSGTSRLYPMVEQAMRDAEQQHCTALEMLRARNGVEAAHCHSLRGNTLQALSSFVNGQKMDMLVVGSIYRRGFERLLLGSTAEEILLHAPCDILLVKPRRRGSRSKAVSSA